MSTMPTITGNKLYFGVECSSASRRVRHYCREMSECLLESYLLVSSKSVEDTVSRSHVRVDGRAKVSGEAKFGSDIQLRGLAYASVVTSSIPKGRIVSFDVIRANRVAGLRRIFTFQQLAGKVKPVEHLMSGGFANSSALPLDSADIKYAGQIVAVVVADTREGAEEAATLVGVEYERSSALVDPDLNEAPATPLSQLRDSHKDPCLGNARDALSNSSVRVAASYTTAVQHHNPIELFSTTCVWSGDRLTIYEPTRYVGAVQHGVAAQLNLDPQLVRVICPFIGGHFGSKLALSQYTALIAIAARDLGRPVRFVATRQQCFTIANHRTETSHQVELGSDNNGKFLAFLHHAKSVTSRFDNFAMEGTDVTASLYAWGQIDTFESVVQVDRNTPGPMRAPPEVPYLFAVESAVDELAFKLGIDPIDLRRRNDPSTDAISGKPFHNRQLMKCFDEGAKAFAWSRRSSRPGSMRAGEWLVGYGCASAVRPAKRAPAAMRVTLSADATAVVETAHHEIGNGLYTLLATQAAGRLGLDVGNVKVRLGDTALPPACLSGGSSTTGSLVPLLAKACDRIRVQLASALPASSTIYAEADPRIYVMNRAGLVAPNRPPVPLREAFMYLGPSTIAVAVHINPEGTSADELSKVEAGKIALSSPGAELKWAYGAQFAEVRIHSSTRHIRVQRLLGAFAAGHIVNRLTALSQLLGGMTWGMSSALLEATEIDRRTGRYVNDSLAEYHLPTSTDAPDVQAIFAEEDGDPLDIIGIGEIGVIGVNAAIANAILHAVGHRFRKLPIRIDDLLSVEPV